MKRSERLPVYELYERSSNDREVLRETERRDSVREGRECLRGLRVMGEGIG